jgi:hypothetical protein
MLARLISPFIQTISPRSPITLYTRSNSEKKMRFGKMRTIHIFDIDDTLLVSNARNYTILYLVRGRGSAL